MEINASKANKPMNPKVSVIVPNYNHASYLKQRIDSILNQTFQDFEVIILDDCSTDNSLEVLSHYKNHNKVSHCVFNDTNSGSTFKQWDKGIQLAKGEWIWIAESDDWAEPEFLETINTHLRNCTTVNSNLIIYFTLNHPSINVYVVTYSTGSPNATAVGTVMPRVPSMIPANPPSPWMPSQPTNNNSSI